MLVVNEKDKEKLQQLVELMDYFHEREFDVNCQNAYTHDGNVHPESFRGVTVRFCGSSGEYKPLLEGKPVNEYGYASVMIDDVEYRIHHVEGWE